MQKSTVRLRSSLLPIYRCKQLIGAPPLLNPRRSAVRILCGTIRYKRKLAVSWNVTPDLPTF